MKSCLLAFWSWHQSAPFKIILNPEPKDFGFVYIREFVSSDTQVCSMWRGIAKFDLNLELGISVLALRLSPLFDAKSKKCWRSSCKLPWSSPPVFSANAGADPGFSERGAPLKMWLNRAERAKRHNGVGSRDPLKGPWWGPGAKPWRGSRGQCPRKLLGFFAFSHA